MESNGAPTAADSTIEEHERKRSYPERGTWSSQFEFLLSCLGYCVGLGNVWRFPWVCYVNGGGAFLIPYFLMLLFVGIPAFSIELIIGQYSGCGPLTVFSAVPLFQGIGWGMLLTTSMLSIFYTMLLGYSLYYLVVSFQSDLPWDHCQHDYNTDFCYTKSEAEDCEDNLNGTWFAQTCYNGSYLEEMDPVNKSNLVNMTKKIMSSAEQYLLFGVVEVSEDIDHTGGIKWELVVALGAAWFLCWICVIKGIRSSGKVVYFTAIFPYLVLFILLIRALTLPGSSDGVKFFIEPNWEKLKDEQVWADAAAQIFFTLSVGGGGLMTFASYNKFNNNIYRDIMIVSFGNCLTSVFAGFVIFSILGYMAHIQHQEVSEVVTAGSGLAFIAYPTVVAQLPLSQFWAVLFFVMLVTLGLDSLFAGIEVVLTSVADIFPSTRKRKPLISLLICAFYFLCGLTLCTRAGLYWLDLISYYGTGWSLIVIGLIEVVVFAWIFGARKLMKMVEEMTGSPLHFHWWLFWAILTPAFLVVILVFNVKDFEPLKYGDPPEAIPVWAQALGWMMTLVSIAVVFLVAVIVVVRSYKDPEYSGLHLGQRIVKLCKPDKEWKPNKCRPDDEVTLTKDLSTGLNGYAVTDSRTPYTIPMNDSRTTPNNYSSPPSAQYMDISRKYASNVSVVEVGYDSPAANGAFTNPAFDNTRM